MFAAQTTAHSPPGACWLRPAPPTVAWQLVAQSQTYIWFFDVYARALTHFGEAAAAEVVEAMAFKALF